MNSSIESHEPGAKPGHGTDEPGEKFFLEIEGHEHPWHKPTIDVPEIRKLGKIPDDQSIIVEDPEGCERTLGHHEVITLKPGHRVGRAPKYKRG